MCKSQQSYLRCDEDRVYRRRIEEEWRGLCHGTPARYMHFTKVLKKVAGKRFFFKLETTNT